MVSINSVLKEALESVSPSKIDLDLIESSLKDFLEKFEGNLKRMKVSAEVFIGGSYAKNTMVRKKDYDIDIFVRFEKTDKNMSSLTRVALKDFDVKVIHGSRDYFQVGINEDIFFEIIPVKKIKNPKEAENITDLSYSHVKYIRKKIKTQKILDDIRLAKVFCYANGCYGAESYVKGFSGYAIELLVYYYKSFLNFIKAMANAKDKIIIDIEKGYKNKLQVMMDINESKLNSPVILVDPTYKQRNAAAALSEDTFKKFRDACKSFLKNPSIKAFKFKKIDFEKMGEDAKRKGFETILMQIKTNHQEGDIAGSKLLKFCNHLGDEVKKFFEIKNSEFDYSDGKIAKYFLAVKSKKELLVGGPLIKDKKNLNAFRKKHKKSFAKNGRVYAKERIDFDIREFIKKWKLKNKRKIKEMGIEELKIVC